MIFHQMERWYNLQIYLNSRFHWYTAESGKKVIQDRTIYEDAHMRPTLFDGLMTNVIFRNFFELMESTVKALILHYLRSSTSNLWTNT
jgi:deoxyadenosine/deoxycytidine kinase